MGQSLRERTSTITPTTIHTPVIYPVEVKATLTPAIPSATPLPTRKVGTSTPTLIAFHALETPIGIAHPLVIHQVQLGESLTLLSRQFGTTTSAIQQVNFNIQFPILVGTLIIIPVNQTDVSGMPSFEAYMVESDIPAEELAKQLMVDPAVFEYYNELKDGQMLIADEWVLVPYISTPTP
jgi:hypothetical protein